MLAPNSLLLRMACLCAVSLGCAATALAQVEGDQAPAGPSVQTEGASSQTDETNDVVANAPAESPAEESFQLPAEHHAWAKFLPGAWRELRTVTETFSDEGQVVSRNVTTQKEVLQAVAEGKYVLQVQATVDLGGKRIVGDWKTRGLQLATDEAGPMIESRRLKDQSIALTGRSVECQVWELRYRDGPRNVLDVVHYYPQSFPFVLQRQTFADNRQADSDNNETTAEAERLTDLVAQDVPYFVGEQLLGCSLQRTFRHRAKGDTLRLALTSASVPGGDVAVSSIDFDTQGRRARWSVTSLLDFGETPPDSDAPVLGASAPEPAEQ